MLSSSNSPNVGQFSFAKDFLKFFNVLIVVNSFFYVLTRFRPYFIILYREYKIVI